MGLAEPPQQVLSRQLSGGERLLWSGRPRQGLVLRPADAYMIPFSLMWGGFTIFWEYGVLKSKAGFFFTLWGIPFVLVGLYLIFGRFFVDAGQRANTYYGLTDQQIIILSGLLSRNVTSLSLRTLSDVSLSERADRSGTIRFGPGASFWTGQAGWPGSSQYGSPSFEMIENAREVFERIRAAQKSS